MLFRLTHPKTYTSAAETHVKYKQVAGASAIGVSPFSQCWALTHGVTLTALRASNSTIRLTVGARYSANASGHPRFVKDGEIFVAMKPRASTVGTLSRELAQQTRRVRGRDRLPSKLGSAANEPPDVLPKSTGCTVRGSRVSRRRYYRA